MLYFNVFIKLPYTYNIKNCKTITIVTKQKCLLFTDKSTSTILPNLR